MSTELDPNLDDLSRLRICITRFLEEKKGVQERKNNL